MDNVRSLGSLLEQQIRVIYRPQEAFGALKDAPFSNVLLSYGILLLLFNSILSGILSFVGGGKISYIFTSIVVGTFGLCILAVFGLCVLAAIFHFLVLLSGGRKGFRKTLAVTMYGTTPILLTGWIFLSLWTYDPVRSHWIAYAAYLVSFLIWLFVLMAIGIRKVQDLTRIRSLISAGITGFCIFFVMAVVLFFFLSVTQNEFWIEPNSDAGKICNDSSECQGKCISQGFYSSRYMEILPEGSNITGTCSSTADTRGCQCILNRKQNGTYAGKYDRVRSCVCVD